MEFVTHGMSDKPVVVFVHGSCTTAETCYSKVIEDLKRDHYCVLCRLDGHYDGSEDFISLDDEAEQIEVFINKEFGGRISLLAGLSLGATICVRLIERNRCRYDRVLLDGVYVLDKGKCYASFCTWLCSLGIARIRKGGSIPDFLVEMVFGKGNASIVEMMYPNTSPVTISNVFRQVYRYKIDPGLEDNGSRIVCVRGEYEPIPAKSYKLLKAHLKGLKEIVIPHCGHAQFLFERPDEYIELLRNISNDRTAE